jgi:hypothetical protein
LSFPSSLRGVSECERQLPCLGVVFWNVLTLRRFIPASGRMMRPHPHKFVEFIAQPLAPRNQFHYRFN